MSTWARTDYPSGDGLAPASTDDVAWREEARRLRRWAASAGWEWVTLPGAWSNQARTVAVWWDAAFHELNVMTRERIGSPWSCPPAVYPLTSFDQALDLLAAVLRLVPAHFSPAVRDALVSHATACERASDRLAALAAIDPVVAGRAYGYGRAAASARDRARGAYDLSRPHENGADR